MPPQASLQQQALAALGALIAEQDTPTTQYWMRRLQADQSDTTAREVLQFLGIPPEVQAQPPTEAPAVVPPVSAPPVGVPPSPVAAGAPPPNVLSGSELRREMGFDPIPPPAWEKYRPTQLDEAPPPQIPPPPVQRPVDDPLSIVPQAAEVRRRGRPTAPATPPPPAPPAVKDLSGGEAGWPFWKMVTGGIPPVQRGADVLAERIDPTVTRRTRTLGDTWEDQPWYQRYFQWKGEREYDEDKNPWMNPVYRGTLPPGYEQWPLAHMGMMPGATPEQRQALNDWLYRGAEIGGVTQDDLRARQLATGIQVLGDLPSGIDAAFAGGGRLLRGLGQGIKRIRGTDRVDDVMERARRDAPLPEDTAQVDALGDRDPLQQGVVDTTDTRIPAPWVEGQEYRGVAPDIVAEVQRRFGTESNPNGGLGVIDIVLDPKQSETNRNTALKILEDIAADVASPTAARAEPPVTAAPKGKVPPTETPTTPVAATPPPAPQAKVEVDAAKGARRPATKAQAQAQAEVETTPGDPLQPDTQVEPSAAATGEPIPAEVKAAATPAPDYGTPELNRLARAAAKWDPDTIRAEINARKTQTYDAVTGEFIGEPKSAAAKREIEVIDDLRRQKLEGKQARRAAAQQRAAGTPAAAAATDAPKAADVPPAVSPETPPVTGAAPRTVDPDLQAQWGAQIENADPNARLSMAEELQDDRMRAFYDGPQTPEDLAAAQADIDALQNIITDLAGTRTPPPAPILRADPSTPPPKESRTPREKKVDTTEPTEDPYAGLSPKEKDLQVLLDTPPPRGGWTPEEQSTRLREIAALYRELNPEDFIPREPLFSAETLAQGGKFGDVRQLRAALLETTTDPAQQQALGDLFDAALAGDPAKLRELDQIARQTDLIDARPATVQQEGVPLTQAQEAAEAYRADLLARQTNISTRLRTLAEELEDLPAHEDLYKPGVAMEQAGTVPQAARAQARLRAEQEALLAEQARIAAEVETLGPPLEPQAATRDPGQGATFLGDTELERVSPETVEGVLTQRLENIRRNAARDLEEGLREVQTVEQRRAPGGGKAGFASGTTTAPRREGGFRETTRSRDVPHGTPMAEVRPEVLAEGSRLHKFFAELLGGYKAEGLTEGMQQPVRHVDEDVNKILENIELYASRVFTTAKGDTAIASSLREAYKSLHSALEQGVLGMVDQDNTVEQLVEGLVRMGATTKEAAELPGQAGRRLAPLRLTPAQGEWTQRKLGGLAQQGTRAGAPTAKPKPRDKRIFPEGGKKTDTEGWRIAESMAINTLAGAEGRLIQMADFTPTQAAQIVSHLKDPKASLATKALWEQYLTISYKQFKNLEWGEAAKAFAEHARTHMGDQVMADVYARQAALFDQLYQAAFADVNRIANAIADTQRTPTSWNILEGGFRSGKQIDFRQQADIELPQLPGPEAEGLRPGTPTRPLQGEGSQPTVLKGYDQPLLGRSENITRVYAPIPTEGLKVQPEKLTLENVLLQEVEYLRIIEAQMDMINEARSVTNGVTLYSAPHLITGVAGVGYGAEAGDEYARQQGWGPAATVGSRVAGATIGALGGMAVPNIAAKSIRKGFNLPTKVDAVFMNMLLSSPRSWLKAWMGAHNGAITASLERSTEGVLVMLDGVRKRDPELVRVGQEAWKEGSGLLKDIAKEDLRFITRSPNSLIKRVYGIDVQTEEGLRQAEELLKAPVQPGTDTPLEGMEHMNLRDAIDVDRIDGSMTNAFVARVMRAPDWAFQRLMVDRGFDMEEARRYTLTGTLRSNLGKNVHSWLQPQRDPGVRVRADPKTGKMVQEPAGLGMELVQTGQNLAKRAVAPISRVPLQYAEMGAERTIGPALAAAKALGWKGAERVAPWMNLNPYKATSYGLGSLVAGGLGAELSEHADPTLAGLTAAALGPFAPAAAIGAGLKQAFLTGEPSIPSMVTRPLEEGSPLDFDRPLGGLAPNEWGNTLGKYLFPAFLRDLAGGFDPVPQGRQTGQTALREAFREGGDLDLTSPGGGALQWTADHAPGALGFMGEVLNVSPWASSLPPKPVVNRNVYGTEAFSTLGLPRWYPAPGGYQALPESAQGMLNLRTPADAAALAQRAVAGPPDPTALGAAGSLVNNLLTQTFRPTYQDMRPALLAGLDEAAAAMKDYGASGVGLSGPGVSAITGLRARDAAGNAINRLVPSQAGDALELTQGDENRRLMELIRGSIQSGRWQAMTPEERLGMVELFKAGGSDYAGGLGDPRGTPWAGGVSNADRLRAYALHAQGVAPHPGDPIWTRALLRALGTEGF
jgi:hypothetical protein